MESPERRICQSGNHESAYRESHGQEVHTFWNHEVQNHDQEESAIKGQIVSISENRDSRDQQSQGKLHFGIGKSETPIRGMTAVI
jgi:hypothetical protein